MLRPGQITVFPATDLLAIWYPWKLLDTLDKIKIIFLSLKEVVKKETLSTIGKKLKELDLGKYCN